MERKDVAWDTWCNIQEQLDGFYQIISRDDINVCVKGDGVFCSGSAQLIQMWALQGPVQMDTIYQ
jgi:hypothetical protein